MNDARQAAAIAALTALGEWLEAHTDEPGPAVNPATGLPYSTPASRRAASIRSARSMRKLGYR